ncbi:hypothetical protein [Sorangium sp. So ce131]|uniref:hypothetical protein n=1 Tax=Sorangium sp. So ce131 TaxID=3133282 RepID=UPI003F5D8D40
MRHRRHRWFLAALIAAAFGLLFGIGARFPDASEALASRAMGPLSRFALPSEAQTSFEGRVVERLNAGAYTYLQIERPGGARSWAVTLASSKGARASADRVRVTAMGFADHFDSKRLGRSFDDLYFAVVRPL